jgi:hypothetical protein
VLDEEGLDMVLCAFVFGMPLLIPQLISEVILALYL